ncbi:MAG: zinc-dependent metalloprotease [Actinomycetota bacterium]
MSSGNPPGDFPFFDLSGLLGGLGGRDPWQQAAELAAAIASDRGSEPNLDPVKRMQIEDLARVAELQVGQAVGVTLPAGTKPTAVTRGHWARRSVEAYRPFFERFGEALSTGMGQVGPATGTDLEAAMTGGDLNDLTGQMMGQMFATLGPLLVSTSAGTLLGHLGQQALGQYDLPIPRGTDGGSGSAGSEILVVPSSIDDAAAEWGVPVDELRLWVLLHELTVHAVISVPHVGARLEALLVDFASAFRPNEELIAERFGSITDLSQLQELSESLSDPDVVLSLLRTPAHDLLVPQLDAMVATVLGYVDHTVATLADGLIGSHETIRSRFRQRWIDVAPADRFMERLLGLEIDGHTLERGDRFIRGLVERAGDEGLERLWGDELDLPTAAEVDAPGLWLARIGHDGNELGDGAFDVPDDLSGLDDTE